MSDVTLYGLLEEMRDLEELLMELDGEINEENELKINELNNLIEKKTDSCVGFIEKQQDLILLAKNKIKELTDFKKQKEKSVENFKTYVTNCIMLSGRSEIAGEQRAIRTRKPSKKVNIIDEKSIPPQYKTIHQTVKVDSKKLLSDLKAGKKIDGVELADTKPSIILKMK